MLVALGGAVGSVVRWLLAQGLDNRFGSGLVPVGVLAVNVLGCLLIGLLLGTTARGAPVADEQTRLLLATGLCGGFTTFSTFSHQTIGLLQAGRVTSALLYVGLSISLSLIATALGLSAARYLP